MDVQQFNVKPQNKPTKRSQPHKYTFIYTTLMHKYIMDYELIRGVWESVLSAIQNKSRKMCQTGHRCTLFQFNNISFHFIVVVKPQHI